MIKCGYYGCALPAIQNDELCEEHDHQWIRDDYEKYKALVEEGHTRYSAALQSGMADPPE